jgi:hypothetical protein
MAYFLVRIELHQAQYLDYVKLHAFMTQRGFSRTITSDDRQQYALPTAEYFRISTTTIDQVTEDAKSAVAATGLSGGVIVAQAERLKWHGLSAA